MGRQTVLSVIDFKKGVGSRWDNNGPVGGPELRLCGGGGKKE